ncbi:hypothetical protein D3C71_1673940 [compost metagenome]
MVAVEVPPSPKFQLREAMLPSASLEESLKFAVSPLMLTPKLVTGAVLPLSALLIAAAYCAVVPCAQQAWISSYSHRKPPLMPALVFQPAMRVFTCAGLSPALQPLPCLVHRPGMTVMPIAVFQVAGLLPAPPS